ncbi:MAG: hypothetical protein DRI57_14250 [Deltaproteobacteria bacterium]|nr:MAG: hypothetical protein DRI57_14250 [Deltaproteobacteria bacterium]
MKTKFILAVILVLMIMISNPNADQSAPVKLSLGNRTDVMNVYAYPNNCNRVCYIPQTLEETVSHYLSQSVNRDGFPDAEVEVACDDSCTVILPGTLPSAYPIRIKDFFDTGLKAFGNASKINQDKKWQYGWRFFLPVGLPLLNHRSVQLLHFPPDYTLEEKQDYLDSKTSSRWESLLEANGIPASEVALYEAIIDISPIAAPSDAGSSLGNTYDYFVPYVRNMLNFLLPVDSKDSNTRPLVAYGSPVRKWVKNEFNITDFKVNTAVPLKLSEQKKIPALGANHPSFIWYAVEDWCHKSDEKSHAWALRVMEQDMISACWQAKMAENRDADIHKTLDSCTDYWESRPFDICMRLETKVCEKTEEDAKKICNSSPKRKISSEDAGKLENVAPMDKFLR